MYNDFMRILAGLKYWNIRLDDPSYKSNFSSRIILQKLSYICQKMGLETNYSFNFYIHGPYSISLTNDYYHYHNNVPKMSTTYEPNNNEIKIFKKIEEFLFSHSVYCKKPIDLLEAATTIMYINEKNPDLLDDELFEKTKKNKQFLSDKTIIIANNIVKELLFKPEYLTDEIKDEIEMWDDVED